MDETFYDILAARYDTLQSDMDCGRWADYIEGLIKRFCRTSSSQKKIVDLGCGTGSVDIPLALKGFDVTGIDNAQVMLEVAASKENSEKVCFVLGDITDLEMDYDADCFVSLLDTLDHIMEPDDLMKIFRNVSDHLLPGGVFIFDVITLKHLEETFADNVFYQDYEDFLLLWVNNYDSGENINTAELTFFESDGSGRYIRYDGNLVERYYPEDFFIEAGRQAGLTHLATLGELSDEAPDEGEERIFMVFIKE